MGFDLEQLAEKQKYGRLLGHKEKRMLKKTKPKTAQKPTKTKRGSYGYHCKRCGEYYQHLWQLSQHHNNTHKPRTRKTGSNGLQWTDPLHIKPDKQNVKTRQVSTNRRIALGWCIPNTWRYIRIWKIQDPQNRLILWIEPLEVEKTRLFTTKT